MDGKLNSTNSSHPRWDGGQKKSIQLGCPYASRRFMGGELSGSPISD
jgi:hypothetical protein